jgi:hypothetical protein
MIKVTKTLLAVVIATIVSLPSLAETLCQRKNQDPVEKYPSRVQAIRLIASGTCPKGFRKVGVIPSTSDIEAISTKIFQANATSLKGATGAQGVQGAQGPQGVQGATGATGPEGSRSGLAPLSVVLNTSSGFSCQKVNLANYCDDADGCVIRLIVTDKTFDVISPFEAVASMEEVAQQSFSKPGISFTLLDHVRTNGALGSPWISTVLDNGAQYSLWVPIANSVALTNYTHANCPGQSGLNGAAFTGADARSVNVMASSRYVVKMTVFDN